MLRMFSYIVLKTDAKATWFGQKVNGLSHWSKERQCFVQS